MLSKFTKHKKKYEEVKSLLKTLHSAAAENDIVLAEQLLGSVEDIDSRDEDGATALHHAIYNNHIEMLNLLIKQKADVNARIYGKFHGLKGYTPLQVAADKANIEISKILINHENIDFKLLVSYSIYRGVSGAGGYTVYLTSSLYEYFVNNEFIKIPEMIEKRMRADAIELQNLSDQVIQLKNEVAELKATIGTKKISPDEDSKEEQKRYSGMFYKSN